MLTTWLLMFQELAKQFDELPR